MDIDDPIQVESRRPHSSLPPFARDANHFSSLEPNFGTSLIDSVTGIASRTGTSSQSGSAPNIENVIETARGRGSRINETVILDDDDDDTNTPNVHVTELEGHGIRGSSDQHAPSASTVIDVPDDRYGIEEEMVQAAIEASRQDAAIPNQQYDRLVCDNFMMQDFMSFQIIVSRL